GSAQWCATRTSSTIATSTLSLLMPREKFVLQQNLSHAYEHAFLDICFGVTISGREPVGHGGHRAPKLVPHRQFLEAARAEKSDITLQALCDRLSAERGVKADTSMMSRFFRKIGVTFKKRPLSRASRIAPAVRKAIRNVGARL